jgi:hypothetical protein
MIIDKVSLSGPASYLRAGGSVNLASGGGTSLELDEGVALTLDGLNLQFDAASNPPDEGSPPGAGNLLTLYSWSAKICGAAFPGIYR